MQMKPRKDMLSQRFAELKKIRQPWDRAIGDIFLQLLAYVVDINRKNNRVNEPEALNTNIINTTPVEALNILAAGMMAGITSPARDWWNPKLKNEELGKLPEVKAYLQEVKKLMTSKIQESNWYDALSNNVYRDLGSAATAACFVEEDPDTGVHMTPLTWGEYVLDSNSTGEVDVCFREMFWTVRQIVEMFGEENCSPAVKMRFARGELNTRFEVNHAIFPNTDRIPGMLGPPGMAFQSLWWEPKSPEKDRFLREGGYREFPVLAPRWMTVGQRVYGYGPGWNVVGDCRALQHREIDKAKMIDKIVDPPLATKGVDDQISLLPGAVNYLGDKENAEIKTLMTVQPGAISEARSDANENETRINKGMFVNLWQATLQDERNQARTATEVQARQQEVMLMLGPLLQSLNNELLKPFIDRTYAILDRNDMLPIPPEVLQGQEFEIEFISIMHQAQRSAGAAGLRGLVQEVMSLMPVDASVVDKLDTDIVVDEFASMFGVSAKVVRGAEAVDQLREARAAQQQQLQQQQDALAATEGLKNMSGVDPGQVDATMSALAPVAQAAAQA